MKVTSWSVTTERRDAAGRGRCEARRVQHVDPPAPRGRRQRAAARRSAGARAGPRRPGSARTRANSVQPSARSARRSAAGGQDGQLERRELAREGRHEPAQIGLRAAGDAGVEEQRVERDMAGPRHRRIVGCARAWATSSGTSSRATGATSRGISSPARDCWTSAAARRGWRSTSATTRAWTARPRPSRGRAARAATSCSPTPASRCRSRTPRSAAPSSRTCSSTSPTRWRSCARSAASSRRAAACSPPRPTRSAGSGTTTRTGARSPARGSGCCSPTRAWRSSRSATSP